MSDKINDGGPAFPQYKESLRNVSNDGMSLRAYAAINLKQSDSGIDWLDEMILKAKRDEIAAKAMQAMIAAGYFPMPFTQSWKDEGYLGGAKKAFEIADAMLKARES